MSDRNQSITSTNYRKSNSSGATITYLNRAFGAAISKLGRISGTKAVAGTPLYDFQVEYCYLIHAIQHGPSHFTLKRVAEANTLIADVNTAVGAAPKG